MITKPTTELMKKYLLMKLTLPISADTISIDNTINELKRIKEEKKVERVLQRIDYQINKYLQKISINN